MKTFYRILLPLFLLAFLLPGLSEAKKKKEETAVPIVREVAQPLNAPLFAVIKGVFPTQAKALSTQAFIQQLLVNTPSDGLIESAKLSGLPKGKWVIASLFDSEEKAKWWLHFSDRNNKLPRPQIKQIQLAESAPSLPYFPEAKRDEVQRFHTEEEVLIRLKELPDLKKMLEKDKKELKFIFTTYPRTNDFRYEVEVMEPLPNGNFVAYDFINVDAFDLNHFTRYLEGMESGKEKEKK